MRDTPADDRETRPCCLGCGTQYAVDRLRVFGVFENAPSVWACRSRVLQARSDEGDVHIEPTAHGGQADNVATRPETQPIRLDERSEGWYGHVALLAPNVHRRRS